MFAPYACMVSGEDDGCNERDTHFVIEFPRLDNLSRSRRATILLFVAPPTRQHGITSQPEAQMLGEQVVNGVATGTFRILGVVADIAHELVAVEALAVLERIQNRSRRIPELVLGAVSGFDDGVHACNLIRSRVDVNTNKNALIIEGIFLLYNSRLAYSWEQ